MKGKTFQNEPDEMEHYSIRKTKPNVERQNIITDLEHFQEVSVDGTPADCRSHSLRLSLDKS